MGRKGLTDVAFSFIPDTILVWQRRPVAKKFDGSKQRSEPGRSTIDSTVEGLIVRMATENKIEAMIGLPGPVDTTHGIKSSACTQTARHPARAGTTHNNIWQEFFSTSQGRAGERGQLHRESLNFRWPGHVRRAFFMRVTAREHHIAGITKYWAASLRILQDLGANDAPLPPRTPNLNPQAERWVRLISEDCSHHDSVWRALGGTRSYRIRAPLPLRVRSAGVGNLIAFPNQQIGSKAGSIERRERLGGLLDYYDRAVGRLV